MALWRLLGRKASFVPLGSDTAKHVWGTYRTGQQQSGAETSLGGRRKAGDPTPHTELIIREEG